MLINDFKEASPFFVFGPIIKIIYNFTPKLQLVKYQSFNLERSSRSYYCFLFFLSLECYVGGDDLKVDF